jgi:hypothetical protein
MIDHKQLARFKELAPKEWGCRYGCGVNDPRHYSGIYLSPIPGCLTEIRVGEDLEPTDAPLLIGWGVGWILEKRTHLGLWRGGSQAIEPYLFEDGILKERAETLPHVIFSAVLVILEAMAAPRPILRPRKDWDDDQLEATKHEPESAHELLYRYGKDADSVIDTFADALEVGP